MGGDMEDMLEDSEMPPEMIRRVVYLQEKHERKEKIQEEYKKERAALEKKYETLYGEVFELRMKVVSGEMDEVREGGGGGVVTLDKTEPLNLARTNNSNSNHSYAHRRKSTVLRWRV